MVLSMSESESPGKVSAWVWPIAGALVCVGLGFLWGLTMVRGGGEWYQALEKPVGNPPSWIFGPVWTVLYVLMGIAVGRLIHRGASGTVTLFVIQFLLNLAWTPVFFGAHRIVLALVIILALGCFLGMTIRSAEKVDKVSAFLLVPYLLWIMYATYLNASIGWLNR